jgi:hypothetical protein
MTGSTLKVGWIVALIIGFALSLVGEGRFEAMLGFLVTGGLFTGAFYADKAAKDRAERHRINYEREFGPHPSRRTQGQEHMTLAEWLQTENGRNWSKLHQARDFLANRHPDLPDNR